MLVVGCRCHCSGHETMIMVAKVDLRLVIIIIIIIIMSIKLCMFRYLIRLCFVIACLWKMLATTQYLVKFLTFFSKMKCIVFSAQIMVTFHFFSYGRDFFLVFKYVYVYICFLWRLLNLSFSNVGTFFLYRIHFFKFQFNVLYFQFPWWKRFCFFIWWGILSSFQICMVYIGFYGRFSVFL